MVLPNEHFTKPSLVRVAERCHKTVHYLWDTIKLKSSTNHIISLFKLRGRYFNNRPSVMFNPTDKEGGVLRFQTNSMSFYQKMNIRQNNIEGNLLRYDQDKLDKQLNHQLRALKWESIDLRYTMKSYSDHMRVKIKRRKDEHVKKKEMKKLEREMSRLEAEELKAPSPPRFITPPLCYTPKNENTQHRKTPSRRSVSAMAQMVSAVNIGPELMEELGLSGVEVPKIEGGWAKVSRTVLELHRKWDRERNRDQHHKQRAKTAMSDPEGAFRRKGKDGSTLKPPERPVRTSTQSNQSYFHTCLARPFSYEDFADRKISCKENENMWMSTLREPYPRVYKRFTVSGEENSITQRQFSERNLEKAKQVRKKNRPLRLMGDGVSDKITRMKFTSSKILEERAELGRKAEEGKLQTDKLLRRHKYLDKNISVADISRETPSYLRYRYSGSKANKNNN